jgi:hypothetical protein
MARNTTIPCTRACRCQRRVLRLYPIDEIPFHQAGNASRRSRQRRSGRKHRVQPSPDRRKYSPPRRRTAWAAEDTEGPYIDRWRDRRFIKARYFSWARNAAR